MLFFAKSVIFSTVLKPKSHAGRYTNETKQSGAHIIIYLSPPNTKLDLVAYVLAPPSLSLPEFRPPAEDIFSGEISYIFYFCNVEAQILVSFHLLASWFSMSFPL